jgi:hypothetical protein
MGVMNYWFFKRATDLEKDQPMYYFRMVEPDFTPLPVYSALSEEAHRPPVMYPGYHQESHWAVTYQGDWRQASDSQAVLGGYRESRQPGDSLTVTFAGPALDLVLRGEPGARVEIECEGLQPPQRRAVAAEGRVFACPGVPGQATRKATVRVAAMEDGGSATVGIDAFVVARKDWSGTLRRLGVSFVAIAGLAMGGYLAWGRIRA